MNNKLPYLYVFAFLFLSDFVMYAAPPVDDEFEPAPDAAPINSKLIVLLAAGILFALYTFRRNKKERAQA